MREIKIKQLCVFDNSLIEQVAKLYKQEKFLDENEFNFQSIRRTLKNSFCVFGAFDGSKLVGIFRALSDGVADAYLLDLIVDSSCRKRGVATALCKEIVSFLHGQNIEWVVCISTPEGYNVHNKIGTAMTGHTPFRFFITEAL